MAATSLPQLSRSYMAIYPLSHPIVLPIRDCNPILRSVQTLLARIELVDPNTCGKPDRLVAPEGPTKSAAMVSGHRSSKVGPTNGNLPSYHLVPKLSSSFLPTRIRI